MLFIYGSYFSCLTLNLIQMANNLFFGGGGVIYTKMIMMRSGNICSITRINKLHFPLLPHWSLRL